MARPRVHEVAKELGLTSKEVLAHLEEIGNPVKSHASTIDEALAERVRNELGNGAKQQEPVAPPAVETSSEPAAVLAADDEAPADTAAPVEEAVDMASVADEAAPVEAEPETPAAAPSRTFPTSSSCRRPRS
jgi:translation initiation factor IF-2